MFCDPFLRSSGWAPVVWLLCWKLWIEVQSMLPNLSHGLAFTTGSMWIFSFEFFKYWSPSISMHGLFSLQSRPSGHELCIPYSNQVSRHIVMKIFPWSCGKHGRNWCKYLALSGNYQTGITDLKSCKSLASLMLLIILPTVISTFTASVASALQIDKVDQAIADCSEAIKLDDTYLKAYMRRAKWWEHFLIYCQNFSKFLLIYHRVDALFHGILFRLIVTRYL